MPIQFRCTHCGQLLSVSRKKAGASVTCPACVHRTEVPPLPTGDAVDEDSQRPGRSAAALPEHEAPSIPAEDAWRKQPNIWNSPDEEDEVEFEIATPALQESGLDMTPMVDVTFLLLIFFMITASFSMQKSLETTAPQPEKEGAAQTMSLEDVESESVVVEIDEEDNLRVDDEPVAGIGELRDVLAAKIANEGKTEMLIEVNRNAKHGTVVAVTDAGIDVQMQKIRRSSKRGED